jgi:hypothetical protein
MKRTVSFLWLGIFLLGLGSLVSAQADEIELTRTVIQAERQAIVASNMELPDDVGVRFWPLYREYRNEVSKIGDRRVKLITTYAQNYENLSDETADWMVSEFLAIEKANSALRESWAPRFGEVLAPKQLARFYQIENKLDAIINYDLAGSIPLVK